LAQEASLLGEDTALFLGKAEIGHPLVVGAQARTIRLVRSQALERDQPIGDVIRTLVRHPIADDLTAALRNDRQPAPCVLLELAALEGIEPVADENGDRHASLLVDR